MKEVRINTARAERDEARKRCDEKEAARAAAQKALADLQASTGKGASELSGRISSLEAQLAAATAAAAKERAEAGARAAELERKLAAEKEASEAARRRAEAEAAAREQGLQKQGSEQ